jgi:membrane-associated protease RseP (regulator of RpoE activity)
MKTIFNQPARICAGIFVAGLAAVSALAADGERKVFVTATADADAVAALAAEPGQQQVFVRTVMSDAGQSAAGETLWLGVGVEETSKPLAAQLDLKPGAGLVVDYVSTNSPAAAAGLQENDVLVEMDGQMLVDQTQLRKLVQMHADGDSVKIDFYRAGKKQSVSAKLAKKTFEETAMDGDTAPALFGKSQFRFFRPQALPGVDSGMLNEEIQRAMEQAQRAVKDAMRQSLNGSNGLNRKLEIINKRLGNFADGGVNLGNDATVVVKNEGEQVRTMVKKDETGTYVIVADPAKHLTAHDANSKLLFDGAIESPAQQQKVPKEVWKKVAPMVEQLNQSPAAEKPSTENN